MYKTKNNFIFLKSHSNKSWQFVLKGFWVQQTDQAICDFCKNLFSVCINGKNTSKIQTLSDNSEFNKPGREDFHFSASQNVHYYKIKVEFTLYTFTLEFREHLRSRKVISSLLFCWKLNVSVITWMPILQYKNNTKTERLMALQFSLLNYIAIILCIANKCSKLRGCILLLLRLLTTMRLYTLAYT